MTKRDYEALADAINKAADQALHDIPTTANAFSGVVLAASRIVEALQADNPRFDPKHFVARALHVTHPELKDADTALKTRTQ